MVTEKEIYQDVLAFFAMDNDHQPTPSRAKVEQLQIGARVVAHFLHNVETIARSQAILAGIEKRPGFLNGAGSEPPNPNRE